MLLLSFIIGAVSATSKLFQPFYDWLYTNESDEEQKCFGKDCYDDDDALEPVCVKQLDSYGCCRERLVYVPPCLPELYSSDEDEKYKSPCDSVSSPMIFQCRKHFDRLCRLDRRHNTDVVIDICQ